jgi:hypothetical protein
MPFRPRLALLAVACAGATWCGLLAAGPAALASTQIVAISFGDPGWTPLAGDWDGSGRGRSAAKVVIRWTLERAVYRAGERLRITISAPGRVAERAEVRIRSGRLPLVPEL